MSLTDGTSKVFPIFPLSPTYACVCVRARAHIHTHTFLYINSLELSWVRFYFIFLTLGSIL
jgi:hypothetical protein